MAADAPMAGLASEFMGRISGHYEWDDDGLTPGQKREGGLHQNLFDENGKLRGSARFVPDDREDSEPLVVTETVYIPSDQRRRTREQEEFERAVEDLIARLVDRGIARAKPYAEKLWRETVRPAVAAQRTKVADRRSRRRAEKAQKLAKPVDDLVVERPTSRDLDGVEDRPRMSSAEAQSRYLAALAARVYSDEQMRLINNSDVVDADGDAEWKRSLAELPSEDVRILVERMATDPSLLSDETLAELASLFGRRAI